MALKQERISMLTSNIANVVASFTHPTLPRNAEEPTFESIQSIHKLLNQNATSVLRGVYGNTLGLLGLTITRESYRTLAGADFVLPTQPTAPVLPPFAPNVQVAEIMRVYKENVKQFNKYVATAKALKNQLLGAFSNDYFLSIYNKATGYEESTVLQLLQHLYTIYDQLTSMQLAANDKEMHIDYDPITPIEKYIARIKKCMDIVANGGTPYSLEQILTLAFDVMYRT
eukprot:2073268-Ditylum_brightwellii.AAC.1